MLNSNTVSIITPAYCSAKVISAAIESVIAQTYSHWELLIVDDCSTDNTVEVVKAWSEIDDRIKLIELTCNVGPAMARNAALERSKGRWIAFLDSDDFWLPEKLDECLKFLSKNNAGFIFTGYRRVQQDGYKPSRYISVPHTLNYWQLLGNTAIATSTVVLDRLQTGSICMRNTYYDDFDCWLQILKKPSNQLAFGLNKDLMRYRVMNASVSRNKLRSSLRVWRAYRDLEKLNIVLSLWYFLQYAVRAFLKYR